MHLQHQTAHAGFISQPCQQYTAFIFVIVSIVALILSIILPTSSVTSEFVCLTPTGPRGSTHTMFIIYIPAVVSLVYTVWCISTTRDLFKQQPAQPTPAHTGVSITFISSFLVIPVVYHSGLVCLPDIYSIFLNYACIALCWHVAHVNTVRNRYTILLCALSAFKIITVILKVSTLHHVSSTTWIFLLVDGTVHLLHIAVRCIAASIASTTTQVADIITTFTSHCQLILLIAISLYAAASI